MDGSDFVMPVIVGGAWLAATATYIYLKNWPTFIRVVGAGVGGFTFGAVYTGLALFVGLAALPGF